MKRFGIVLFVGVVMGLILPQHASAQCEAHLVTFVDGAMELQIYNECHKTVSGVVEYRMPWSRVLEGQPAWQLVADNPFNDGDALPSWQEFVSGEFYFYETDADIEVFITVPALGILRPGAVENVLKILYANYEEVVPLLRGWHSRTVYAMADNPCQSKRVLVGLTFSMGARYPFGQLPLYREGPISITYSRRDGCIEDGVEGEQTDGTYDRVVIRLHAQFVHHTYPAILKEADTFKALKAAVTVAQEKPLF